MITKDTLAEALSVPGVSAIEATSPLTVYVAGDTLPSYMTASALSEPDMLVLYDTSEPLFADLRDQAQTALDANDTYLGISSPTNAQVVAQVKALTQQTQRIIKAVKRLLILRQP